MPAAPAPSRLDLARPLDREVAATLGAPARWRRAAVVASVAIPLAGVVVAVPVVAAHLSTGRDVAQVYNLLGTALAALLVWRVAGQVARTYGGWRAAFGFDLPAHGDGFEIARWSALQVLVRFALAVVLSPLLPDGGGGGNLEGVTKLSGPALLLMGIAAVVVAPVFEELIFRGVLLRAVMRRTGFRPAALVSSGVFAVLHLGGISAASAVVPALVFTAVFGVLQCVLVRRTGRLGPAMGVHAVTNLFFVAIALAAGA